MTDARRKHQPYDPEQLRDERDRAIDIAFRPAEVIERQMTVLASLRETLIAQQDEIEFWKWAALPGIPHREGTDE